MDAAGRARREALRVQAAGLLVDGVAPNEVSKRLRVSVRSVYRWQADFERGGYRPTGLDGFVAETGLAFDAEPP